MTFSKVGTLRFKAKVVVSVRIIAMLPFASTAPTLGLIVTLAGKEFSVCHRNVTVSPEVIVVGIAVKETILGTGSAVT